LVDIAKAVNDDLQQIIEIENEAFSPPWTFDDLSGEINRDDSYFIIAAETTKDSTLYRSPLSIRGFAVLRQVGEDAELLKIAVRTSARRSGVGDMLMTAVLKNASEKAACNSIFLEVRRSNKAAVMLYEKHGFTVIRTRKDYYDKPVEDALIMAKTIQKDSND